MTDEVYNGRITFLFSNKGSTFELYDHISATTVAEVILTAEQTLQMMSRLGRTKCSIEYGSLECVGKKMEMDHFEFPIPNVKYTEREKVAREIALRECPEGWIPDNYYGSKESFFRKDDQNYARVIIRRWVTL